ncbi:hypothetical protein [Streptomyces sp. NPDC047000]|uniref:hypothetical protein n=1 Tax=Streptomyces sp. NPDC047000 TaxID=3155474 RepID=UPI0034003EC7
MKLPQVLAAALLTGALLAGCSSPHGSSPGSVSSVSPGPDEGEITPSASVTATSPATGTFTPSDWPTRPVTADKIPTGLSNAAFAKGYTGADYLARLTKRWHISLSSKKKTDFRADDDRPVVWFSSGAAHPTASTELSVTVVWSLDGNLKSLTCAASRTATARTDFLGQCIQLDHPGAHPGAAAHWLRTTTPDVDKVYDQAKKTVDSPLYRSGPAASLLVEYDTGKTGAMYSLRIFGVSS